MGTSWARAIVPLAAAAQPAPISFNPLGINIYGPSMDFTGIPPYIDAVTSARGFSQTGSLESPCTRDANGWPSQDFTIILCEGNQTQSWQNGSYACSYISKNGGAETVVGFGATVAGFAVVGSLVTFTLVVTAAPTAYGFTVTGTTGGVTGVHAYLPAYPSGTGPYAPFTTEIYQWVSKFGWFRAMGMGNTLQNAGVNSSATRTTPTNTKTNNFWGAANSEGYPVEFYFQMASVFGTGAWICTPVKEDGTNGTAGSWSAAVAASAAANMPVGKTLYVEIGDELMFAFGAGTSQWPGLVSASGLTYAQYLATRIHDLAVIFKAAYGSRFGTDCKIVMSHQTGGNGLNILSAAIAYLKSQYGGAVTQWVHVLSVAPYKTRDNTNVPGDGTNHTGTNDTVANMLSQLTANAGYIGYLSNLENDLALATYNGLQFIPYEFGWEISGENSSNTNVGPAQTASGMLATAETYLQNILDVCDGATWLQGDVYDGPTQWYGPEYDLTTSYSDFISNTNVPRKAALLAYAAGAHVPTRNVIAAGSSWDGKQCCDYGWNGSTLQFLSTYPTLAGSAYAFGPNYGQGGWLPYMGKSAAPQVRTLTLTCVNSGSTETTNLTIDGTVAATGVSIPSGTTNVVFSNLSIPKGNVLVLLGRGAGGANVQPTTFTWS
jgi:hypothetical protein